MTDVVVRFPDGFLPNMLTLAPVLQSEGAIEVDGDNICEGCLHCAHPGIRWPASPDGDSSRSWVERCDTCERFDSDLDAAIWVALNEDCGVGIAHIGGGILLDAANRYGRSALMSGWTNAPTRTAVYVDHPARDG